MNFLDEVELKVLADAAVLNIRRVDAIDEVNVLGVACSVDLVAVIPSAIEKRGDGSARGIGELCVGVDGVEVLVPRQAHSWFPNA